MSNDYQKFQQEKYEFVLNHKPQSGMEDDPAQREALTGRCRHPNHDMGPMYIVIPPGKRYRHVCPACGGVQFMYPPPQYSYDLR